MGRGLTRMQRMGADFLRIFALIRHIRENPRPILHNLNVCPVKASCAPAAAISTRAALSSSSAGLV